MLIECLIGEKNDGHLIDLVCMLYDSPAFYVEMGKHKLGHFVQNTRIRQGYPLSPYLFLIVMNRLFKDMKDDPRWPSAELANRDFMEILYVDDTVIACTNATDAETIVQLIQEYGIKFGLKLKNKFCVYLKVNSRECINFRNGDRVPGDHSTIYLGALSNKSIATTEIRKIIKTSRFFGSKRRLSGKKLGFQNVQIYDAVIRAKLACGLESLAISKHDAKTLRAFQL